MSEFPTPREIRDRFENFYRKLVAVHPHVFAEGGGRRIGSTFKVGGLDAQSFYLKDILNLLFTDRESIDALVRLSLIAARGDDPSAGELMELQLAAKADSIRDLLYVATEVSGDLTGEVSGYKEGTDLFVNALVNVDMALQLFGMYDHDVQHDHMGDVPDTGGGTLDQSAIDALFD